MNLHIEAKKIPLTEELKTLITDKTQKLSSEFNVVRTNIMIQKDVNQFVVKAYFAVPGRSLNIHKKADDIRSTFDLVLASAHESLRRRKEKITDKTKKKNLVLKHLS